LSSRPCAKRTILEARLYCLCVLGIFNQVLLHYTIQLGTPRVFDHWEGITFLTCSLAGLLSCDPKAAFIAFWVLSDTCTNVTFSISMGSSSLSHLGVGKESSSSSSGLSAQRVGREPALRGDSITLLCLSFPSTFSVRESSLWLRHCMVSMIVCSNSLLPVP